MDEVGELRSVLSTKIDEFFRRKIDIDERFFQALEVTDDPFDHSVATSAVLLVTALRAQPSIAHVLDRCGVRLRKTDFPISLVPTTAEWVCSGLPHAFEPWFRIIDDPASRGALAGRPTRAYRNVRTTGRLTLIDAIKGCLEARYLDDRIGRRGLGKVSPNDLVSILADRKLGVHTPGQLDERSINRLCSEVAMRLDDILELDASAGGQQFILYHDGRAFRIRPFGVWGAISFRSLLFPMGRYG